MDFSFEKKRGGLAMYMGWYSITFPPFSSPPQILLGTDSTRYCRTVQVLAVALLQGGVILTERLLPPYKLQLS